MSTWTAPEPLLNRGAISVTWHRATAIEDIVIPYPEPKPATTYPAGTAGWWRPTSERWGQFLPDGKPGSGVAMLTVGLDIGAESEQIVYRLSPLYTDDMEAEATE
jgi:hypothetical protein